MSERGNKKDLQEMLGFDNTHQWLLYDDRLKNFFDFLWENVSEANILTENEIMEKELMLQKNEFLEGEELVQKKHELEKEYPGIFTWTQDDVDSLRLENKHLENAITEYSDILSEMSEMKDSLQIRVGRLEEINRDLTLMTQELGNVCISEARKLEALQKSNKKLISDAERLFTDQKSPALFIHQMPLDQYFQKCDTFIQYFSLYMKEHFKVTQSVGLDEMIDDNAAIHDEIETLEKLFITYTMNSLKIKSKIIGTETLIELMNSMDVRVVQIENMERDIKEFESVNDHLTLTNDTLFQDLHNRVVQFAAQKMDLILYENTKSKYERALKRHENDKHLTKIIENALSNAELIWIAMQLDLEKATKRFDNSETVTSEALASMQRVNYMKALQVTDTGCLQVFLEKFAENLSKYLKKNVPPELMACVNEYDRICRLSSEAWKRLLSTDFGLSKLIELNRFENLLKPLVYDGPLPVPLEENIQYMGKVLKIKMQQEKFTRELRNLRNNFKENIVDRFNKDRLWRYKQLLWVWFLSEPKRVLKAIEEVKAAAKTPNLASMKVLGGIKRKT